MEVSSAIDLINTKLVYKPGWTFKASDHTNRFEGTILLNVTYPAKNSDRDQAPFYREDIVGGARASFTLICRDCDEVSLMRQLLDVIMKIECHEAREFLRLAPTNWAPFHPHRVDGMRRYGQVEEDLLFGVA